MGSRHKDRRYLKLPHPMKTQSIVGIILISLGVIALAYQGITYTSKADTIDLGPLKITAAQKKTIPLPPIVGVLTFVGGIVLLVMDRKR